MKTISLLLPDLRAGGAERVSLDLAGEFSRKGYRVEFVVRRSRGELLQQVQDRYPVVSLDCARVREVPRALTRYLAIRKPDGLIASMWPLTAIAPIARAICGVRCSIVCVEHGILSEQYRTWGASHRLALRTSTILGYRLADARVGVSNGVASDMAALSLMPRSKFSVINNPVPRRPVSSAAALSKAERLWSIPRGRRILTVGRLKAVKNYRLLLQAFCQMCKPTSKLMLVGDGEEERSLRQLANDLEIADRVVFAGYQADPTPFYSTADLFVLSSDREGFGNVIVEALASGLPVVSTDCRSGPREILMNGEYGILAPLGNPEALALAMTQALERSHDSDRLQRRALAFEPERAANAYLKLLFAAPSEPNSSNDPTYP